MCYWKKHAYSGLINSQDTSFRTACSETSPNPLPLQTFVVTGTRSDTGMDASRLYRGFCRPALLHLFPLKMCALFYMQSEVPSHSWASIPSQADDGLILTVPPAVTLPLRHGYLLVSLLGRWQRRGSFPGLPGCRCPYKCLRSRRAPQRCTAEWETPGHGWASPPGKGRKIPQCNLLWTADVTNSSFSSL